MYREKVKSYQPSFMSLQSDIHPVSREFSLDISSVPAGSTNITHRSNSWHDKLDYPPATSYNQSLTDYAIAHQKTQSTHQSFSSLEEPLDVDSRDQTFCQTKSKQFQRTDFSFRNGKSNKDRVIETYFSVQEDDVPSSTSLGPGKSKSISPFPFSRSLDTEFKPSALFIITDKLNKAMKSMRSSVEENKKEVSEGHIISQANQVVDVKEVPNSLMNLIKEYTKNPNLEKRLKANKTSFLKNKDSARYKNKENQLGISLSHLSASAGKAKNIHNLNSRKNDPKRLKCELDKVMEQSAKERNSLRFNQMITAQNTPIGNHNRSRSLDKNTRSELFLDDHKLVASQIGNNLVHRRRSLGGGPMQVAVTKPVNQKNSNRFECELIMKLNETAQTLFEKTEANAQEILMLKQYQEIEMLKIQTNQQKINHILNNNQNNNYVNKNLRFKNNKFYLGILWFCK